MDTFQKDIPYALEKLGKSKFDFERTAVSNFKSERHEGSGDELVHYSRAPCLGADQNARGLWVRDWTQREVAVGTWCIFSIVYFFKKTMANHYMTKTNNR